MTLKQALKIIGGLSTPSKMPCYGYSLPANKCIVGMKLRNVANSICSRCYAMRGNYMYKVVANALKRRFKALKKPQWVEAITFAIRNSESSGFFRWHDSGDLQGTWHLANICQVAKNLPDIKFWLPTREYSIVSNYCKENQIPENLNIRLSALMIDGEPPYSIAERLHVTTSGVSRKHAFTCQSSKQGNKCLTCRACWDKNIPNIDYKIH